MKEMHVYTNTDFVRAGNHYTKIMFVITTDTGNKEAFGVCLNNNTGRIECQKYLTGFSYLNINDGKTLVGIKGIINYWNCFNPDAISRLKTVRLYLRKAFNKYANEKMSLSTYDKAEMEFIDKCRKEYYDVLMGLIDNVNVFYNHEHELVFIEKDTSANVSNENSSAMPDEVIKIDNQLQAKVYYDKARQSIEMFKLINANNFNSLFSGNFYPIVKQDGDYCIIKDDNGMEYTVRSNRGKIIKVFTSQE